jgi:hypothetical protein
MEPPDYEEKAIRFGCGFVFGLVVIGFGTGLSLLGRGAWAAGFAVVGAVICGLLAMHMGERFWDWWRDRRWWWW